MSERSFEVDGLTQPVEIRIDRAGVPHVYAEDSDGAFYGQGFAAARDRLWQMDLWRRRGLGHLSEILGPRFLDHDRAARQFQFRGDLDDEWQAYGPDTERICTAFAAGVNAWIDVAERENSLPVEFEELSYAPGRWKAQDIVRVRNQGVYTNAADEIFRAMTVSLLGDEADLLRQFRDPLLPIVVPEGADLSAVTLESLAAYVRAVLAPRYTPDGSVMPEGFSFDGSNNWVVAGSKTDTGRPLLANDPHRDTTSLPGLRYISHVSCPEFDVIGGGEPHLPGISIGHNGTIAFGLTIFPIDQEDVYTYTLDPDDPTRYRYDDGWEHFRVESDRIGVRGEADREVSLWFTRHGPVLHRDPERGVAVAVRAAWLDVGAAPYLGSLGYMRATSWEEFQTSMDRWGTPGENQVYADVHGNIGWRPGGLMPRRPHWDGTLPVPGDGSHEWDGYHDPRTLPTEFNPERGWVATANEFNLPPGHRLENELGVLWASPDRRHRIGDVLSATKPVEASTLLDLQLDTVNPMAHRVLDTLASRNLMCAAPTPAVDMLRQWDRRTDKNSPAAALFEVWFRRHLRPALLSRCLESLGTEASAAGHVGALLAKASIPLVDDRFFVDVLVEPGRWFGTDPERFLRDSVGRTLHAACAELRQRLGPDTTVWAWGDLHHARATHPFKALLEPSVPAELLEVGPLPHGGGWHTVAAAGYDESYRTTLGATFRILMDVGNWDESRAMNAPGQSGDLHSPHHRDLFEPWVEGETFPLLYSRKSVEEATEQILVLQPRRTAPRASGIPAGTPS